jgi:hypothetical protein
MSCRPILHKDLGSKLDLQTATEAVTAECDMDMKLIRSVLVLGHSLRSVYIANELGIITMTGGISASSVLT